MFRTSRLQKIVKVPQVHVIDEVAKVPRSMRRQVPMIQVCTRKDQKPEEVQISWVGQSADNDPRLTMNKCKVAYK